MQKILILIACASATVLPVTAQLLGDGDPLDSVLEQSIESDVTRTVEEQIQGGVQDQVEEEVEQQVQQQVEQGLDDALESTVGNAVEAAVEQSLNQDLESAIDATAAQIVPVLDEVVGTLDPLTSGISEPLPGIPLASLRELPKAIPVVDAEGKPLFLDAAVENYWRAVAREWLLLLDDSEIAEIDGSGIQIVERIRYDALDLTLVRIRVDDVHDSYAALKDLLPAAVFERLDRNHIYYRPQGRPGEGVDAGDTVSPTRSDSVCDGPLSIGVVDTRVHAGLAAFAGASLEQRVFGVASGVASGEHGTAVTGLLIAEAPGLQPLVTGARVSHAAVAFSHDYGQGATLLDLVNGFDWLISRGVSVINVSLAGPPNRILARVVQRLGESVTLVAAVGNEGPAAPPLYPAAYPGVVGVTAVDSGGKVYRWANQGEQVDFSAPGVLVRTLDVHGGLTGHSGTSMAAPVITAYAACVGLVGTDLEKALALRAVDLGEPGRDNVFGIGLLD